jgi:hypothetical protein
MKTVLTQRRDGATRILKPEFVCKSFFFDFRRVVAPSRERVEGFCSMMFPADQETKLIK